MDVSMPIMGGLESTTLIRDHEDKENRARTPIIALTAHAMIGDKERCLAAGVSAHACLLVLLEEKLTGSDGRVRDETTSTRRSARIYRQGPHA